jgi:predicted transcriptional regulator
MEPTNKLREFREAGGLFITQLAKLADVSTKSIERVEGRKHVSVIIKQKIVNGLNKNPDKSARVRYRDVFPNDKKQSR